MLDLCAPPAMELTCGFTELEALDFARSVLDELPDMADKAGGLRRSSGSYLLSFQGSDNDNDEAR